MDKNDNKEKISREYFFDTAPKPFVTVEDLYEKNRERVQLKIINNDFSFARKITEKEIHRPALALSGFVKVFTYWRIQIIGNTEIAYLKTLDSEKRSGVISTVLGFEVPCIIITSHNKPPKELVDVANKNKITLFSTPFSTTTIVQYLSEYLETIFAPQVLAHGSLVDVYGVGLLITGRSAIGKSELTLDLIERGHQLVADDIVHIKKTATNILQGSPNEVLNHHMEIRGLGIIDVRRMFGIRAIRGKKDIDVCIILEKWNDEHEYERIGVDEDTIEILGVQIPLIVLPLLIGKNITMIAEVAAMNHKLKQHGINAAKEFDEKLIASIRDKNKPKKGSA